MNRIAASIVALALALPAAAQVVYPPNFVWNRQADWTARPPTDALTSNGNPDDDQAGRAVWYYEDFVPAGNWGSIGSTTPWYTPASLNNYARCLWDPSWFGLAREGWQRGNDSVPITIREFQVAYQGFYYTQTTWVRWQNESSCVMNIRCTGTFRVRWGANTQTGADVVILVQRGRPTATSTVPHEVLFAQTISRPATGTELTVPIDLASVAIRPGDSIVRTLRVHEQGTDIANAVVWYDEFDYVLDSNTTLVSTHPQPRTLCAGGTTTFSAATLVPGTHTYQWRREGMSLTDAPGHLSGATAATLTLSNAAGADEGNYDCVISNSCGSATSHPASLRVCVADVDDGSAAGACDGGVTIDDLLYYISLFTDGVVRADVDDGTSTGTPDGGVTIDDLLYYLSRFEAGC